MTSDKAYSVEARLNAIIGLIYADGTHQESIGTAAQGVDLQMYDLATPPSAPTAGTKLWSQSGNLVFTSEDANVYATGILYMLQGGTQTIVSTTPAQLGSCSCAVSSGTTYRISGMIIGTMGAFTDQALFRFNGPAVSGGRVNANTLIAGGGTPGVSTATGIGGTTLTTGSVTGGGTVFISFIEGWYTFSAGGTLSAVGAENTAAHPWTSVDAFFDIKPI